MAIKSFKLAELADLLDNHVNNFKLNYFWLEGEIQNYRGSSKHYYFSLSENQSAIKSIIWESTYEKLDIKLENGIKGLFYGKLNYYKNKNEISFIIYKVKLDNKLGDIYTRLENNKKLCKSRGYFNKDHKLIRNINNIGIITRYNSAAYNDLVNTINECYGIKSYIYDSGMQGISSKDEIIYGINLFNKLARKLNLDCIIITRGGGSKEDLWVFNEIDLVKSIFDSELPVITGIGHEIDTSLVDLVADKNCITPTDIGRFIYSYKSLKNIIEYLDVQQDNIDTKIKNLYNKKTDKINSIIDGIDSGKIEEAVDLKINNLNKYTNLIERKLRDYYINKLSTLNYIKSDLDNIINNKLNIKLFRDKTLIINPDRLTKGDIYNLEFNKKIFKIKVM